MKRRFVSIALISSVMHFLNREINAEHSHTGDPTDNSPTKQNDLDWIVLVAWDYEATMTTTANRRNAV